MKKQSFGQDTSESLSRYSRSFLGHRVQGFAVSLVQLTVVVCVWDLARVGRLDSVWATLSLVAIAAPNAVDVVARVIDRFKATKSS